MEHLFCLLICNSRIIPVIFILTHQTITRSQNMPAFQHFDFSLRMAGSRRHGFWALVTGPCRVGRITRACRLLPRWTQCMRVHLTQNIHGFPSELKEDKILLWRLKIGTKTSAVATSRSSFAYMTIVVITASQAMVGDAVSYSSYNARCGRPSATDWLLSVPSLLSFNKLMASRAPFFCSLVNSCACGGWNT